MRGLFHSAGVEWRTMERRRRDEKVCAIPRMPCRKGLEKTGWPALWLNSSQFIVTKVENVNIKINKQHHAFANQRNTHYRSFHLYIRFQEKKPLRILVLKKRLQH